MIYQNSKLSFVFLILIATALLVVLFIESYSIYSKNEESRELINSVNQMTESRNLVSSIKSVQNNSAEDLVALENFVLSDEKLVSLIEKIEGAGQRGMDVSIVSVEKIENKEPVGPGLVRIIIDAQGSWSETLAFVRTIENLPYLMMVDESTLFRNESGWRSRIVLLLHLFD